MRFDFFSFLLGFIFACAIFAVAYRYRARLAVLRDRLVDFLSRLRERLTAGADFRYRQDVSHIWQASHLAGSLIALNDILITPRFWADLPPLDPNTEQDTDLTHVVPAAYDYTELFGAYQGAGPTTRDLARATSHILILGKPGSGKSTALTYLGLKAATKDAYHFEVAPVPVMVHVGDLELPIPDKTDPAQPLIEAAGAKLGTITGPAFPGYCKTALRNGSALLLLDGLEDLPPAHQALVTEWIKNLLRVYPKSRVIATGPLNGYAPMLELGFVPVVMSGWSATDYRAVVDKWVATWLAMLTARRRIPKDQIDPALVAGWLSGGNLGRTPLEVTLKIWTGLAGDAEGPRPVDWIESYFKRFARQPEARKAFEIAAGQMLSHDRYGLPREKLIAAINLARTKVAAPSNADPEDVVDELAGRAGLLAKRAGGRYSFSNPVVAGYLAAKHYAVDESPEAIAQQQAQPMWATAIRFYSTLANASALAAQRLGTPPDAIQSDLFTLASWLGDAPSNAPWRPDVFRRLAQFFVNAQMPGYLRMRAACALVLARDENVTKLFKQSLTSKDPATRQYSAAALGVLGDNTAVTDLANLLHGDDDLFVRWAAALALALIGDSASIEALGQMLLEGNEGLKRTVCEALALHPNDGYTMLKEAIAEEDVSLRRGAIAGLARLGNQPWVIQLLQNRFDNDDQWIIRSASEATIKDLEAPPDHAPKAPPPFEHTGWLMTYLASKGRGVPTGAAARLTMLDALKEAEEPVRMAAADHFGRVAGTDAIPLLTSATRESTVSMREIAYKSLANIAMATNQKVQI